MRSNVLFVVLLAATGLLSGCWEFPFSDEPVPLDISGVVMNGEKPAHGARVTLWRGSGWSGDQEVASTTAGWQGRYRLVTTAECQRFMGGSWFLEARYEAKADTTYPVCTGKRQTIDFQL